MLHLYWNSIAWDTVSGKKYINIYDNAGRIIEFTLQYFGSGSWIDISRQINQYNTSGKIKQVIDQSWNGNNWDNSETNLYTYDIHNNNDTKTSMIWYDNKWNNTEKETYTYNSAGEMESLLIEYGGQTSWTPAFRRINIKWHDYQKDQVESYTMQNYVGMAWENFQRINNTYSANGSVVTLLEAYNGTQWNNSLKYMQSFDANLNLIESKNENWDGSSWIIDDWQTNDITYAGNNQISSYINKKWNGTTLENQFKIDNLEFISLQIKSVVSDDIKIFPIPATDQIYINAGEQYLNSNITIFDMTGKVVLSESLVTKNQSIDISFVPKGIYLVEVKHENKTTVKRIVKQ